jgi:hypothetical protein
LNKQENDHLKEIKKCAEGTSRIHQEVVSLCPEFYNELRKLKFYGDKNMNEILLRQIDIYVARLLEKSEEFEKLKTEKIGRKQRPQEKAA